MGKARDPYSSFLARSISAARCFQWRAFRRGDPVWVTVGVTGAEHPGDPRHAEAHARPVASTAVCAPVITVLG